MSAAVSPRGEPLSWSELEAKFAALPESDADDTPPTESFAAVVPDLADDVSDDERRAALRLALGSRAPSWAVELAVVNGGAAFEGEAGELLLLAVTTAVFTDCADVLRRLAAYLLARGVDRFVTLALLHGWAQHYAAPVPFEAEIRAVVLGAA